MNKNPNVTTIPITKDTRAKLQALMKYGETYDGIIRQLLEKEYANEIKLIANKPK
jgi:transcriptional regulator